MKYLYSILLILSTFLCSTAFGNSAGVYYNPDRSGEGISVTTSGDTLVLFFYTYRDEVTSIPPSISPAPPDVAPQFDNSSTWYIAQSTNYDGNVATGPIYLSEAASYPDVVSGGLNALEQVGTFTANYDGSGWTLTVDYEVNLVLPWFSSLYYTEYDFSVGLIEVE